MSNVYLDDSILTGIANSIRAKTGESNTITPANMATAIANIPSGSATVQSYYAEGLYSYSNVLAVLSSYFDGDLTKIDSISIYPHVLTNPINSILHYSKGITPLLQNQTVDVADVDENVTDVLALDYYENSSGSSSRLTSVLVHSSSNIPNNAFGICVNKNGFLRMVIWNSASSKWVANTISTNGNGYLIQEE